MAVTIQCEQCSAPGTPERVECAKCKGRVIRVCGDCGLKNSLAKRFCDSCGARIDGPSTPPQAAKASPPPKAEPAPKTAAPAEEFVFETLAESAANELEERAKKGESRPRPAEAPPPQIRFPAPKDSPGPSGPGDRPAEKKAEPILPPPPAPEAPASIPPVGLNAVGGLKLDVPSGASKPPARSADLSLPHTVVGRAVPKGPEPAPKARGPQPPKREEKAAPPPDRAPEKAKPKPAPAAGIDGVRKVERLAQAKDLAGSPMAAKLSTALAVVLLVSGGGLWLARRHHLQKSEVQVPITARRYLTAMKSGDFSAAYGMLSEASKRSATIDELKKAREGLSWDFSDVALLSVDGDLAFARYRLKVDAREPEENYLVFRRENGAWRRAFSWNLLRDAEASLERGDATGALAASSAAQGVNARDPLARVLACEALYALRDAARAGEVEKECRAAIESAERYPRALAPDAAALNHVRAVLGDTLKNTLRRYREAADQFTAVLAFGKATASEQCELLLGRGECSLALQDFASAARDFTKATGVCEKPPDADYARRATAVYSGNATREAIELAQQHHLDAGQPAIEWRREERVRLTQEWKGSGRGPLPAEDWFAQHLGGSQYRVDVRAGSAVLFSARVDLWNKAVSVETR